MTHEVHDDRLAVEDAGRLQAEHRAGTQEARGRDDQGEPARSAADDWAHDRAEQRTSDREREDRSERRVTHRGFPSAPHRADVVGVDRLVVLRDAYDHREEHPGHSDPDDDRGEAEVLDHRVGDVAVYE